LVDKSRTERDPDGSRIFAGPGRRKLAGAQSDRTSPSVRLTGTGTYEINFKGRKKYQLSGRRGNVRQRGRSPL
jgi:hypothetical protein